MITDQIRKTHTALSAALCSRDIHLTDRSNCLISNVLGDAMKNLLLTAALVVCVNSLSIPAVSAAESAPLIAVSANPVTGNNI